MAIYIRNYFTKKKIVVLLMGIELKLTAYHQCAYTTGQHNN